MCSCVLAGRVFARSASAWSTRDRNVSTHKRAVCLPLHTLTYNISMHIYTHMFKKVCVFRCDRVYRCRYYAYTSTGLSGSGTANATRQASALCAQPERAHPKTNRINYLHIICEQPSTAETQPPEPRWCWCVYSVLCCDVAAAAAVVVVVDWAIAKFTRCAPSGL